ncbi:MAG: tetraacyldisaccharide 4'-kinase [Planctomycetaceae bacterium]|nr:tetraacyldisaccharide 4'-kinase [Planctomycetaceae bacterium]
MTFDHQAYFDIISGKRTDVFSRFVRACLSVLELPCSLAIRVRNFMYDKGLRRIEKLDIPVVSVGNLTVGGTGKTPFVAWLAKKYLDEGKFPAIVSRGYHADETGWNDEAKELKMLLPDVPQAFSKKRFTAIQQLLEQHTGENGTRKIDVILLDDGFQHRKIFREKNILLIDATNPFGYNRITPRGLLREPISGMKRADTVILSRSDTVDVAEKNRLCGIVQHFAPDVNWVEMTHTPSSLLFLSGKKQNIDAIAGKLVLAFCGLGNPNAFFRTITDCGALVKKTMVFPDHHQYTNADTTRIFGLMRKAGAEYAVCSLKDFVKINDRQEAETDLCAVIISTNISEPSVF